MDVAFVTGAAGFVGSAVARALLAEGYRVRALVRPSSSRINLAMPGLEVVEGDMRDEPGVTRAAAGARYVFHVAADYRLWARDPQEIVSNNRQGTLAVIQKFIPSGIHHILIGPDHLLFLIGLLLVGGTMRQLLLVVTAFTIAHSITLSLAALNIFTPPARLIEPAIALSLR